MRNFVAALYRPLTSVSLALQWAAGDGSPLAFRLVSYALYALTCVAVFRLARTQLPLAVAVASAALFAVHPVHVEAVALGVNQNELWVGLIACVMVMVYLRDRARGGPVSPRALWQLCLLYLTACMLKENALVLPALLPAAELVLVRSAVPLRIRISHVRLLLLLMGALGLAFYWIRIRVLSGSLAGTFTAEGLVGLSATGRALTMLGVVPHWCRLLLWPEHLQADYSPGEIVGTSSWGAMQTLGAVLIFLSVVAAVAARKRAPMDAVPPQHRGVLRPWRSGRHRGRTDPPAASGRDRGSHGRAPRGGDLPQQPPSPGLVGPIQAVVRDDQ